MLEVSLVCLAMNVYYEARNQSVEAQIAVSEVVMNRVADSRFPNTVCNVIKQGVHSVSTGDPVKWKCHFTWYCDHKSDRPRDNDAYRWAKVIAGYVLSGESGNLVKGATHYHAYYVSPKWKTEKTRISKIGDHIFYRWEK